MSAVRDHDLSRSTCRAPPQVMLSRWFLQLWQLVPDPGLVNDRRLDAGHPGPIGEAIECKVLQVLHIAGDDMNYKIPPSGDEE